MLSLPSQNYVYYICLLFAEMYNLPHVIIIIICIPLDFLTLKILLLITLLSCVRMVT